MARPTESQSGFTLAEMLVALAILLFGLTAIAGSMMMGVSTRRGTEMRFRAVHMVDHVYRYLQEEYFLEHDPDSGPLPAIGRDAQGVANPAANAVGIRDYPGMKYTVEFVEDPDHPQVVLARVRISWREQGEKVAEKFERIMIREKPFAHRISRIKGNTR